MNNRKGITIIFTACLILTCAIFFGSFFSKAEDTFHEKDTAYKYYTSIEIKPGDTLWEIASNYISEEYSSINDYISEVKSINSMASDDIKEGHFLTVPYYSTVKK